MTTTQSCIMEG